MMAESSVMVAPAPLGDEAGTGLAFLLPAVVRMLRTVSRYPRIIPGIEVRPGLLQAFAKEVLKSPLREPRNE
jgi:hypothetical protein